MRSRTATIVLNLLTLASAGCGDAASKADLARAAERIDTLESRLASESEHAKLSDLASLEARIAELETKLSDTETKRQADATEAKRRIDAASEFLLRIHELRIRERLDALEARTSELPSTVVAREFILRDEDGKDRASLRMRSGEPALTLEKVDGGGVGLSAGVGIMVSEGLGVSVHGRDGELTVISGDAVTCSTHGREYTRIDTDGLAIAEVEDKARLRVNLTRDRLFLWGRNGAEPTCASLTVNEEGDAALYLRSGEGAECSTAMIQTSSGTIRPVSEDEVRAAGMERSDVEAMERESAGGAWISLNSIRSAATALMSAKRAGVASVSVTGRGSGSGAARIDSTPSFGLVDENGKTRAAIGRSEVIDTNTGVESKHPPSTIMLFGPDGKVIWMEPRK